MKKVPEIFVNKIDKKIDNNDEVFYSYKSYEEENDNVVIDEFTIQKKLDDLFRSNDFVYKKRFHIKTKNEEDIYTIISKSYDYLLTLSGKKIFIKDIIEIDEKHLK